MKLLRNGFFSLGRWWRIPVQIHWTTPLGIFLLGHLKFRPGYWLGMFLLVLWHELGHAFWVRRYAGRVLAIELNLIGGLCRWRGDLTSFQRAVVAWGGVLAQGIVLLVAIVIRISLGAYWNLYLQDLVYTWTWTNLWMIGLNLLADSAAGRAHGLAAFTTPSGSASFTDADCENVNSGKARCNG